MPYKIRKQKCKQSDGDAGNHVLSYTTKKGKKIRNCHTSKKKARGQIAAIEGPPLNAADQIEGEELDENEALVREWVRETLKEGLINERQSRKAIATSLATAARTIVGNDVTDGICQGPGAKGGEHCRITIKDLHKKNIDLETLAKDSVESAFNTSATVKNIGLANSGKYDTYQVTDVEGNVHNIIFRGGLTGGQRGGGYAYEEDISKNLESVGVESIVGTDTTESDVFVKTKKGNRVGIEVKGIGAKFGQPTLYYSFSDNQFIVPSRSRSKENAQLTVDILNDSQNTELIKWLDKIRRSWNKLHPKDKMTELGVQIQSDDWEIMMQSDLKQSGPKIPMDISKIVQYYKKKNADYIQIQSKGLYTITDKLGIRATQFSKAAGGMGAFIKPEILKSGGNKVLRASITLSYAKLPNSNMDLAKPEDAEKFADALNKK